MHWRSKGIVKWLPCALAGVLAAVVLAACMARGARDTQAELQQQVMETERAFAATMKARDFEAFGGFLSKEAVFMGPGGARRGRDAVALSAGFAYPANAEVQVGVDQTQLAFYTANRSAFARNGRAAVAAFEKGRQAIAKSPGPRNATVTDTFSLRGFSPAYAAINKACPAK